MTTRWEQVYALGDVVSIPFYAEPVPAVKINPPARCWHAGKVLFEKDWLRRWF